MEPQWKTEWNAISARLNSVAESYKIAATCRTYGSVHETLHQQLLDTFATASNLFKIHHNSLPQAATNRFKEIETKINSLSGGSSIDHVGSRLTLLAAFHAELQWLLHDPTQRLANITERAFLHLSRLIVADPDVASKWKNAFADGEVRCEKLGGAHLIHHGIWAFKTDAAGGRSDLVMGNRWDEGLSPAVEGLVLTEWKLVRDPQKASDVANEAMNQARTYSTGILAGIELASTRYIVLVSKKNLMPPQPDVISGNHLYRHINIIVDPSSPSIAAKATKP
jgi:hypothetical protein